MDELNSTLPCIVCKKSLDPVFDGLWAQPTGGVSLADYAAYGSRFDGEGIVLSVCDDCLAENHLIVRSFKRKPVAAVVEYSEFAPLPAAFTEDGE